MSVVDDAQGKLINDLHAMARTLENGEHAPFYKIADLLRKAQQAILELAEQPPEVHVDRVIYTGTEATRAGIHMLHEQAHGRVPFGTCQSEPCRDLVIDLPGPAPLSMPLGGVR